MIIDYQSCEVDADDTNTLAHELVHSSNASSARRAKLGTGEAP